MRLSLLDVVGPTTAGGTELPDDAIRPTGQTYCIGTAKVGPYVAAGIVACTRIVLINALCTEQNNLENLVIDYCYLDQFNLNRVFIRQGQ